jgi:hypothetical protein
MFTSVTRLMSVKEFARDYGIGLAQAYNAAKQGEIPSVRIGRRLWILRGALEKKVLKEGSASIRVAAD